MNKLVLIGNGFDLAHGLMTRYSDFILWYLNMAFTKYFKENYYEDNLIKIIVNRPFEFTKFTNIQNFKKLIREYEIEIEYHYSFVEDLIHEFNSKKWVDLESYYYSRLVLLYKEIENYSSEDDKVFYELKLLNECFESLKEQLIEYLSTINNSIKTIDSEINSIFSGELFNNIDFNHNSPQVLFLNFNYTGTLDMYIPKDFPTIIDINHIHGSLNDENNPIIFGYGDEKDSYYDKIERLNNNEFLKHIKSFGYFKSNNYRRFSKFLNRDSFNVYIIGHSCGLSDRILLSSIFEHEKCEQIKIFYHQKSLSENDFFEKTQEISRHFSASTKAKMRTCIVPFSGSMPLKKYKE